MDSNEKKEGGRADYFLDITDQVCPMTFVKTRLLIEKMSAGQTARVRLQGAEPIDNVPRSVREYGDEVISLVPEEDGGAPDGVHILTIRKA